MTIKEKIVSRFIAAAVLAGVSVFVAACSNSAPKCSDKKTADLVYEITKRELSKTLSDKLIESISFRLESIRTTGVDDKTGAQSCAAQLVMKSLKGEAPIDITYKSEMTDKGEQYVTVWGL